MSEHPPGMAGRDSKTPRHVAIIMDGNGRWANRRRLPRFAGHRAGVEAIKDVVRVSVEKNVEVLTLFAFSSENWKRPAEEVGLLMNLFVEALRIQVKKLDEYDVRLRIIGDLSAFSAELNRLIGEAQEFTANNKGLRLNIAANYGGQWDIANSAKRIAERVAAGELTPDEVTPESFAAGLTLADCPVPDLFIRTGGEMRISNFLLWDLAYSELFFTDCLWPDFDREQYEESLRDFARRQRRFGRTSEQVSAERTTGTLDESSPVDVLGSVKSS
ncbi:MAG: polyprenyl diphosphate synthase [Pseudomonadota bacterium]